MNDLTQGSSIAIRTDAVTVLLGVVSAVHDDGTVDGLQYPAGADPVAFFNQAVGNAASDAVGSAWFPASALT